MSAVTSIATNFDGKITPEYHGGAYRTLVCPVSMDRLRGEIPPSDGTGPGRFQCFPGLS